MLRDLHTVTQTLVQREGRLQASIHNLGPYVRILSNIIGTGPGSTPTPPTSATWRPASSPRGRTAMSGFVDTGPPGAAPAGRRSWSPCSSSGSSCCSGPEGAPVTANFCRAVSVFEGSEVRILGVPVGDVTAVVPEGYTVRVEMEYDEEYQVPKDAQAVIITPTLTADRFVQLSPASPPARSCRTARRSTSRTPARRSSSTGSTAASGPDPALGPNGVNTDGTLDNVLGSARSSWTATASGSTPPWSTCPRR